MPNSLELLLEEKYGKPSGAEYFNISETVKEWLKQKAITVDTAYEISPDEKRANMFLGQKYLLRELLEELE